MDASDVEVYDRTVFRRAVVRASSIQNMPLNEFLNRFLEVYCSSSSHTESSTQI
uniref:Uncharacterized protein n=1 Tax=Arion vulgaris TaxID=1028688 RepID=A0A0B7A3X5_9EUPU